LNARVQFVPRAALSLLRIKRWRHFHNRLRGNLNRLVPSRNVKVVHRIAEKIAIRHHVRARMYFQRERQAPLP